jgi:hypothetical protein
MNGAPAIKLIYQGVLGISLKGEEPLYCRGQVAEYVSRQRFPRRCQCRGSSEDRRALVETHTGASFRPIVPTLVFAILGRQTRIVFATTRLLSGRGVAVPWRLAQRAAFGSHRSLRFESSWRYLRPKSNCFIFDETDTL